MRPDKIGAAPDRSTPSPALEVGPRELEPSEALAQPIRVVDARLLRAGHREQRPPRIGERPRRPDTPRSRRRAARARTGRSRPRAPRPARPPPDPDRRSTVGPPRRHDARSPLDLLVHASVRMRPPCASVAMRGDRGAENRGSCRSTPHLSTLRSARNRRGPRGSSPPAADLARQTAELVIEVGLDVLEPLGERRQAKGPEVDAREQILPEAAGGDLVSEIAVGAGDELKIALLLPCPSRPDKAPSPRSRAAASPARRGPARRSRRGTARHRWPCGAGPAAPPARPRTRRARARTARSSQSRRGSSRS